MRELSREEEKKTEDADNETRRKDIMNKKDERLYTSLSTSVLHDDRAGILRFSCGDHPKPSA